MNRIINFWPAFDKRSNEPGKDYGIHGVELSMVLKGELGAISFLLFTNWHLPHVAEGLEKKVPHDSIMYKPLPADISYHSPKPLYEYQEAASENPCKYIGVPCYCDGSTLNAQHYFNVLVAQGDECFWQEMEKYYLSTFGDLK